MPITAFFYDELADDNSVFSPLHIDAMIEPANGWPDSNRKAGIKVCDPRSTEHIVSNLPKYVRLAANIQSKKEDTTQQHPVNTTAFCPLCGSKVRVGVVLMAE